SAMLRCRRPVPMIIARFTRALAIAAFGGALACSSPGTLPAEPTPNRAALVIVGLTASVQPLTTTPQPGLVYVLSYQLHESGGRMGATAVTQHFAFSNGQSADGNFSTVPHVAAGASVTIQSSYSVYPAATPAAHVTFTITYTDDAGQSGTVT